VCFGNVIPPWKKDKDGPLTLMMAYVLHQRRNETEWNHIIVHPCNCCGRRWRVPLELQTSRHGKLFWEPTLVRRARAHMGGVSAVRAGSKSPHASSSMWRPRACTVELISSDTRNLNSVFDVQSHNGVRKARDVRDGRWGKP
jgi:hypothetical protein